MRISHLNQQRKTVGDIGAPIDIEFTGPLILSGAPTEGVDAATKDYVDTRFLSLDANDLKYGVLPIGRLPAFSGDFTNVAGSNVFTLNPSGITPGTYRKVTVDSKGRVIGSSALSASDIPPLDWSKVTKNKPNSLVGYGITDGIKLTGDTITSSLRSIATPTEPMHAVTRGYVETVANNSGGMVSTGIVISYSSETTPSGYLRCNGGEVRKDMYPELYSVVGDRYTVFSNGKEGAGKPWKQQYEFNSSQSGDITGWTTGPSLPGTLGLSQAIVTKNRVYLLGGDNGGSRTSTVYTAPINEDGTLGVWGTGTPLPGVLGLSQAIVTKNRVYLLGGTDGSSYVSTVYTAPINEDGTLGTWTTGPSLPGALDLSQAVITKNRVYLLGGRNGGYVSTVYTAPINEDGTLGVWATGTSLPGALALSQAIVTKNRVYLLGGQNSSGVASTVYTAPINEDGTLGAWTTGTSLPVTLSHSQAIATKNRVYLLGGRNGGWVSTVYTAPFSGGLNDYSSFYDGTITLTTPDKFRLPNYTSQETLTERLYIKY